MEVGAKCMLDMVRVSGAHFLTSLHDLCRHATIPTHRRRLMRWDDGWGGVAQTDERRCDGFVTACALL